MSHSVTAGSLVTINKRVAVVKELFNPDESKNQRCIIVQDGVEYCVRVDDLKPYSTTLEELN